VSTTDGVVVEPEDPAVLGANIAVGARLAASAAAFLFMSFVFAFFYLRALNTNHAFHPKGANPPVGFGVAVLACVLVAVAVFEFARRTLGAGRGEGTWRLGSLAAWVVALAAVVVQVIEYFKLPFGATTGGGFGSVFLGYTAVFAVFWLGAVYWIETLWAGSLRAAEAGGEEMPPTAATLGLDAASCAVFLYTMAVIELFAFVLLYLVK
jgi:hypothetical protein